jgi:terminal uridylyltransferase
MSFHPPQPHTQHHYADPVINQAHLVPHQGYLHQLPTASPRALPPNNSQGYREPEHHYILAPDQKDARPAPQHSRLYQPGPYGGRGYGIPSGVNVEQVAAQIAFLDALLDQYGRGISIGDDEILEKDRFRSTVERICREAILNHETVENKNPKFNAASVELRCFGSMASGFAIKASDMDLALLTPYSKPPPDSPESAIPRLLEKKLLDMGFGARLLTRTRVPIIKLCQKPTEKLMSDLIEERKKWESGFIANDAVENEQVPEDADFNNCEVGKKGGRETVGKDTGKMAIVTYHDQLASLHQKPKESLMDYYGSANRLLRKLGSCDIDKSYDIPPEQIRVVTDVCKVFVKGLSDASLKARLLTYQSLQFSDAAEPANVRSLRGIFTQMEGEQWAMAWDNRPLREATEKLEADCQRQIDDWHKLLDRVDVAPMMYNGMLHHAISRLKKIASLQLLFLEQGLHESPLQYQLRAANILDRLRRQNNDHVLAVVIAHYMNGIRNPKIQEALQTMTSSNEPVSLSSLALQHRIVQLADDYKTALSKNLYGEQDREDLEQYINFLRSCNVEHVTHLSKAKAVHTPVDTSIAGIVSKVRNLPDPSQALQKPRDRYKDHLEFPKKDVGIQCDINFSAQLGLHNTLLLRCYSLADSRVRPLVLFIKYWARLRAINTPYRGSLSSYGYVLMVLHYLVNIATPFVCPNLQQLQRDPPPYLPPDEIANQTTCKGYDVRFWRNEKEIANLAERGMLNHNRDSLGKLLRGFFEYYAQSGPLTTGGRGFDWGRDVLSLRTMGGLLTKQQKGWVGARTVTEKMAEAAPAPAVTSEPSSAKKSDNVPSTPGVSSPRKLVTKEEVKEIRLRFLFAIEDPFELDHNVARTVTHDGIVAIRDEFRRAWRIISSIGKEVQEGLLDEVVAEARSNSEFDELMDLLHGKVEHMEGAA